jgi:hypothetical protein
MHTGPRGPTIRFITCASAQTPEALGASLVGLVVAAELVRNVAERTSCPG